MGCCSFNLLRFLDLLHAPGIVVFIVHSDALLVPAFSLSNTLLHVSMDVSEGQHVTCPVFGIVWRPDQTAWFCPSMGFGLETP